MKKEKEVNYLQAMRSFDKALGKKPEETDIPLKDPVVEDGGVDYLKVSKEYEEYLEKDQSEVIHRNR